MTYASRTGTCGHVLHADKGAKDVALPCRSLIVADAVAVEAGSTASAVEPDTALHPIGAVSGSRVAADTVRSLYSTIIYWSNDRNILYIPLNVVGTPLPRCRYPNPQVFPLVDLLICCFSTTSVVRIFANPACRAPAWTRGTGLPRGMQTAASPPAPRRSSTCPKQPSARPTSTPLLQSTPPLLIRPSSPRRGATTSQKPPPSAKDHVTHSPSPTCAGAPCATWQWSSRCGKLV